MGTGVVESGVVGSTAGLLGGFAARHAVGRASYPARVIVTPALLLQSIEPEARDGLLQLAFLAPFAIFGGILAWRVARTLPAEPAGRLPRDPAIGALGMLGYLFAGALGAALAASLSAPLGVEDEQFARLFRGVAGNLLQVALVVALISSKAFVDAPRAAGSRGRALLEGVAAFAITVPAVAFLGLAVQWLLPILGLPTAPETSHETLVLLREKGDALFTALTLAHVAVLVPLAEEAAWRGLMQPAIRRAGVPALAACATTAVLFAGIHWSVLAPEGRAVGLTMLVTLGFALGLLRERTGGILAPVLVHALFNAANVAMTLGSPGAPPR
jgi:membrane protease YdiL (CAAX protease family)